MQYPHGIKDVQACFLQRVHVLVTRRLVIEQLHNGTLDVHTTTPTQLEGNQVTEKLDIELETNLVWRSASAK